MNVAKHFSEKACRDTNRCFTEKRIRVISYLLEAKKDSQATHYSEN